MVDNGDSYISQMLQEIGNLFGGKPRMVPSPITVDTPSPEGYMAPIHGIWHNSGGFDLSMRRADGRIGHQGVDMRAPAGTPIYALTSGVVTGVGTDPIGGNVINIQHPNDVRTYYAHLSTVKVHKGDKVDTNTVIGTVGNTGNARHSFPHLHFQVWKNGQITNPAGFFSIPKYSDLSAAEKQQGPWLSDESKQEALSFNMKNHLEQQRAAFSRKLDNLLVLSHKYYTLLK